MTLQRGIPSDGPDAQNAFSFGSWVKRERRQADTCQCAQQNANKCPPGAPGPSGPRGDRGD